MKQGEGGEQGDPLMPALFALGLHDTLEAVKAQMLPGEHLFAYLDDVYILCKPERVKKLYDLLEKALKDQTGLKLNTGKTRVYNRGGVQPEGVQELGAEVWVGGHDRDAASRGLKVLGTPVGTPEYTEAQGTKWLEKEEKLWTLLPQLPDLQSAWLLLLNCAAPRSNYRSRTVAPQYNGKYAKGHDEGLWATLCALLGKHPLEGLQGRSAAQVATLPLRKGGLGLRSAVRTGPAAFWASWADTLPMMAARCPDLAGKVFEELEKATASEAECLRQVSATKDVLSSEGFECPSWREVHNGLRPPKPPQTAEPGEVRHGWQYHAASRRETYYREAVVLTERGRPSQALLRSQAGRCAGEHLTLLPLSEELQWENAKLRALLLRRLRLPLDLDERRCRCGKTLDWLGDHRAACGTGGVLQTRAVPLERMWARVGREAGARVRTHAYLNDLNVLRAQPAN